MRVGRVASIISYKQATGGRLAVYVADMLCNSFLQPVHLGPATHAVIMLQGELDDAAGNIQQLQAALARTATGAAGVSRSGFQSTALHAHTGQRSVEGQCKGHAFAWYMRLQLSRTALLECVVWDNVARS